VNFAFKNRNGGFEEGVMICHRKQPWAHVKGARKAWSKSLTAKEMLAAPRSPSFNRRGNPFLFDTEWENLVLVVCHQMNCAQGGMRVRIVHVIEWNFHIIMLKINFEYAMAKHIAIYTSQAYGVPFMKWRHWSIHTNGLIEY